MWFADVLLELMELTRTSAYRDQVDIFYEKHNTIENVNYKLSHKCRKISIYGPYVSYNGSSLSLMEVNAWSDLF